MTNARSRPRWTAESSLDHPEGGCPCDDCGWRRVHPMEERAPRPWPTPRPLTVGEWLALALSWLRAWLLKADPAPQSLDHLTTAGELEQYRIHEEHTARELAMWEVLVWLPATRMTGLALALSWLRAWLLKADPHRFTPAPAFGAGLPPPQSLDHLMTAPRTGPPAGALAVGNALPDRAGGAVIVS